MMVPSLLAHGFGSDDAPGVGPTSFPSAYCALHRQKASATATPSNRPSDALPSNGLFPSLRRHRQMCDVRNGRQSFASEAVRLQRLEVCEFADLGSRVPLAEDWQVRFLLDTQISGSGREGRGGRARMPQPLSWICNSLMPPSLTVILTLVAPASRQFSRSSLIALAGRAMICASRASVRGR